MLNFFTLPSLYQAFAFLLDIGLMAIAIFACLKIVENNTRTIQIFKGILFVFILNVISKGIGLKTIDFFTGQFLNWGVLAVIIIFQPEIRSILEKIGKSAGFSKISALSIDQRYYLVDEVVKASEKLSKSKTGAIISIEQNESLSEYIKTGTALDSLVSSELLGSIFQYGTPLHDGAVIIQGDKIACASAYFPPTTKDFSSSYGARHRAAVGISEINDCITIVISEETGMISIAFEGELKHMNVEQLKAYLEDRVFSIKEEELKAEHAERESRLKMNFSTKKEKVNAQDDRIKATKIVTPKKDERGESNEEK